MEREGKIQSAPQQQINLQPMIEQIRAVQYAFREIADSLVKIAECLDSPKHTVLLSIDGEALYKAIRPDGATRDKA